MFTVTVKMAESLVEYLEVNFDEEAEVYEDYSGRGMYGSTCVGLVTKASPVVLGMAISQLAASDDDWEKLIFTEGFIPFKRQDGMGLSTIYY